ncbi:MAG: hypothetical protein R3335_14485 [Anaerolineales bacterium]|nr:hypothetical protein [Anaerolineales bacterium]
MPTRRVFVAGVLMLMALPLIAACSPGQSDEEIEAAWAASAHADAESRSFTLWNDSDPPEIPERCAKCHSTHGYRDFLGVDGATPGQVDMPAPVGSTIECEACHNEAAGPKDSAVMPSGVELIGLRPSANCMECHQGRAWGGSVTEAAGSGDSDKVDSELSLPNIHNNPAGPTQYGAEALGGYEYSGKSYRGRYDHVVEFDSCTACHDAHSLKVKVETCSACHLGVRTNLDLAKIRTGNVDYDGDGDIAEGIAGEIETMQARLLLAMQVYAAQTEGAAPLEYEGGFVDDQGESYSTWTPRLLRSAYNYRYSTIDPGGYAHHGEYLIQLLFDSLEGIGGVTAGLTRPGG